MVFFYYDFTVADLSDLKNILHIVIGKSSIISETQHPEGLQKIQMLEDYSR